ncbi:MAG: gliding motility protein GldL [Sphingobacteriaceae bacterium]
MAQKSMFKDLGFNGINSLISWGASVVIVGLMFKILHWPGGEYLIALGLITEACLFLILGFVKDSGADDSQAAGGGMGIPGVELDKESVAKIETGLRNFADKVSAISNASDAALVTGEFTNKVKSATANFDQLSAAFAKASANLQEMSTSNIDSKAYHEQVNNLAKNMAALNAVYELELQDSSTHLKSMSAFYKDMASTMKNFNESVEDAKQFKEEVAKLSKNLASLNAVYGNMLTAMNQPRNS